MPAAKTKTVDTFAVDAQKAVTEQMEKAAKSVETATAFGQETLDAFLKAQTIAAKAAEEIQAELVAFSKKSLEEGVAHAKDLASAQTVTDFIEKQAGYAKVSFDGAVRQAARLNEMTVAAMKDAMAPISARAASAVELVKTQAA